LEICVKSLYESGHFFCKGWSGRTRQTLVQKSAKSSKEIDYESTTVGKEDVRKVQDHQA